VPIATVSKMTAWSFSRWSDYQLCPLKAKLKHIDKIKEPGNEAMDRGSAIHKLAEDFTNLLIKKLPEELKAFKAEFMHLKKQGAIVEDNWGFDRAWEPCAWDDWTHCWLRVKLDACYLADDGWLVVIDHKTGKVNEEHLLQLSLYALVGLIMFPDAKGVRTRLWYLDHGIEVGGPTIDGMVTGPGDYPRSKMESLKAEWEKNVKAMFSDTKFAPRAGAKCRWCYFSKDKNGNCKY
jgi:CRISPR/Cas system-associated exonuclease Cas4 (RecB family)